MTASWSPGDGIRTMIRMVRIVEPTDANAERLWQYYRQSYRDDDELLVRACSAELGVDGLTETLTAEDIAESMRMPDTVTFEVGLESGDCGGFVTVRYATRDAQSREGFKAYFLGDVFQRDSLRFRTNQQKDEFFRAIDYGQVLYFAELVSKEGREALASLVFAAYQEVCLKRLGSPSSTFVGKCLDSVRIGRAINLNGNRPVKALAESLGLEQIALCDQIRRLHVTRRKDLIAQAFPDAVPPAIADTDAVLSFALYLGKGDAIVQRMIHRL